MKGVLLEIRLDPFGGKQPLAVWKDVDLRNVFLLPNKNTSPTLVRANIFLLPGGHLWDADFLVVMEKDAQYFVSPIHHWEAFPGTLDGQWILHSTSRLSYYSTIQLALIIMTHNISSHFKACLNSWLHLIFMTTETSIIIIILTLQMYLFNKRSWSTQSCADGRHLVRD